MRLHPDNFFWCLALLVACVPPDSGDDTGGEPEVQDTEDSGEARLGLAGKTGEALVTVAGPGGFEGAEEWHFTADSGAGEELCRIRYQLDSTEPRTDCDLCDWAFELVLSEAELVTEIEPGCDAVFGVAGEEVGSLDGTEIAYGYTAEYFGHAEVLLSVVEGAWTAVTNATWDPVSGAFSYDRQDGYVEY